ncbi:MAG: hypothetical protein ACFFAO_04955 [Candidatus Hermodarchaeota archaeon]
MSQKKPKELYKERNQRVMDSIALKEPDRVPLTPLFHFYPMIQKGMTPKEAMYDINKAARETVEIYSELNVDQVISLAQIQNGPQFLNGQVLKTKLKESLIKEPFNLTKGNI